MKSPKIIPSRTFHAPQPLLQNPPSGYPIYPVNEDIYRQFKEETEINPEEITASKSTHSSGVGADLDIPGAELDDEQESIGSEDEENNYYSIGGDDHNDLEERGPN